jgi:hypothetical protein
LRSLSIFFLCVKRSNTENITEKNIRDITVVLVTKIIIIGNENPAIKELSDTYFVTINVIKNTPKATNAGIGAIAKARPKRQATPFPPLNPT